MTTSTTRRRLVAAALLTAPLTAAALVAGGPATAATGPEAGRTFTTTLTGAEEVPGPGDPDGTGVGSITINVGQRTLCYDLSVSGIDPATAAHVHEAGIRAAGPVVVPLGAPSNGRSTGCVPNLDRDLLKDIAKTPADYYLNVHNAAFKAGALRGQLGD